MGVDGRVSEWTSGGWDEDDLKNLSTGIGEAGLRFSLGRARRASKIAAPHISARNPWNPRISLSPMGFFCSLISLSSMGPFDPLSSLSSFGFTGSFGSIGSLISLRSLNSFSSLGFLISFRFLGSLISLRSLDLEGCRVRHFYNL
jgi:hypothetical protein